MTREEILGMVVGRELDALVAEKVMGLTYTHDKEKRLMGWKNSEGVFVSNSFKPSASIAVAWEVVERLDDCLHLRQHGEDGNWEAFFCGAGSNGKANADTAPEAICKAALLVTLETK